MADDLKKYDGRETHQGPDHSAPYPVSRMAPAIDLVDLAKEIQKADDALASHATARLKVIADQVRSLQDEARKVLDQVERDQALHRARCSFQRTPGRIYHVYRRPSGELQLSMLSPEEWKGAPPHEFVGSYRLENDMSWTPAEELDIPDQSRELVQRLLGAGS